LKGYLLTLILPACVVCVVLSFCSKTFGTYEIQQHNRSKRTEAEQLMQAAAALTAAAATPKADEQNNAQQAALVSTWLTLPGWMVTAFLAIMSVAPTSRLLPCLQESQACA
jgi:ABC-type transport system involved in cytochrome c biogenesis permease subunit